MPSRNIGPLDVTQELTRAVVRIFDGYIQQGMRTSLETLLKRQTGVAGQSLLRTMIDGRATQVRFETSFGMKQFAALATSANVAAVNPEVAQMGELFGEALRNKVQRRQGVLELHQRAAQAAQEAVLREYDYRVNSVRTAPPYEREGRLHGKLHEALSRPDFVQATSTGVAFANAGMLDAVAAHWYRLNFGAGQAGATGKGLTHAQLVLFGQPVGTLTLERPPSASFIIPAGIFLPEGQFYLRSQINRTDEEIKQQIPGVAFVLKPRMTKGIAPRRFLDPGITSLAQTLPRGYENLIKGWLQEASKEIGRRGPLRGLAPGQAGVLAGSIRSPSATNRRFTI